MKEEIVNKHPSVGDRDINPVAVLGEIVNNELLPKSIDEAIREKNWYEAMKLEYNSLVENKFWELVENKGNKPIVLKFFIPSGEITRYKAKFVAKYLAKFQVGVATKYTHQQHTSQEFEY